MAYAAAAGDAMEESDEDIFSLQLPESPESFDEPGTSYRRAPHHAPANMFTAKPAMQVNKECTAKGTQAKEENKGPLKKGEREHSKNIFHCIHVR